MVATCVDGELVGEHRCDEETGQEALLKGMEGYYIVQRVFKPTLKAAGLPTAMRFHDLRHTHVAMLIAQGEHPKTIQTRLGHASITTTLDTYGHLFEGLDEAAADRLDAAGAPSARPQTPGAVIPLRP